MQLLATSFYVNISNTRILGCAIEIIIFDEESSMLGCKSRKGWTEFIVNVMYVVQNGFPKSNLQCMRLDLWT